MVTRRVARVTAFGVALRFVKKCVQARPSEHQPRSEHSAARISAVETAATSSSCRVAALSALCSELISSATGVALFRASRVRRGLGRRALSGSDQNSARSEVRCWIRDRPLPENERASELHCRGASTNANTQPNEASAAT